MHADRRRLLQLQVKIPEIHEADGDASDDYNAPIRRHEPAPPSLGTPPALPFLSQPKEFINHDETTHPSWLGLRPSLFATASGAIAVLAFCPFRLLAPGDPLPARPLRPAGQGHRRKQAAWRGFGYAFGSVPARPVVDPRQHDGVWRHSAAGRLRAAGRALRLFCPSTRPSPAGSVARFLAGRRWSRWLLAFPALWLMADWLQGLGDDRLSLALVRLHPDRQPPHGLRSPSRGAGHHPRPAAHRLRPLAGMAAPQAGLAAAPRRPGGRRPGADAAQLGDPG